MRSLLVLFLILLIDIDPPDPVSNSEQDLQTAEQRHPQHGQYQPYQTSFPHHQNDQEQLNPHYYQQYQNRGQCVFSKSYFINNPCLIF